MNETENRYNTKANFVPGTEPQPLAPQRRRRDIVDVTAVTTTPATIYVDAPLQTLEGAKEATNGWDRSIALVVRLAPFSAIWLVLAIGISWGASMGGWFTLLLFAGLTAVTYAFMDKREYEYSRNGLERHKVNTLADLKRDEMAHQHELRKMALEAHLKMLGVNDDDA